MNCIRASETESVTDTWTVFLCDKFSSRLETGGQRACTLAVSPRVLPTRWEGGSAEAITWRAGLSRPSCWPYCFWQQERAMMTTHCKRIRSVRLSVENTVIRSWRTACVDSWPRYPSWTTSAARTCSAARMRCHTGFMRTRNVNSRFWPCGRRCPNFRRSFVATVIESKS